MGMLTGVEAMIEPAGIEVVSVGIDEAGALGIVDKGTDVRWSDV